MDTAVRAKQSLNLPSAIGFPLTSTGKILTTTPGTVAFIQNLGTVPLIVSRGAAASSTLGHYVLKACGTAGDGTGDSILIDDFIGDIYVNVPSGSASYIAWTNFQG